MTISDFNQFALSRDEIKKIVGGFYDSTAKKKCRGTCSGTNPDGGQFTANCISSKQDKIKVCSCGPTESKITSNDCAWT